MSAEGNDVSNDKISADSSKHGQGGEAYTRCSRLSSGNIPPIDGLESIKDAINNYKVYFFVVTRNTGAPLYTRRCGVSI